MDRKFEIIDIYKKKISLLKKHNKLYFGEDNPEISDRISSNRSSNSGNTSEPEMFLLDITSPYTYLGL